MFRLRLAARCWSVPNFDCLVLRHAGAGSLEFRLVNKALISHPNFSAGLAGEDMGREAFTLGVFVANYRHLGRISLLSRFQP